MECPQCHNPNPDEALYCGFCNSPFRKAAPVPVATVSASSVAVLGLASPQPLHVVLRGADYSNVQPLWHFCLLSLTTFGVYQLYWFYKHWKWLQKRDNLNISPFWRSIFSLFYVFSLFRRLATIAHKSASTTAPSTDGWAMGFVIIGFVLRKFRLPDPYWLISVFSFLPMLPVVSMINEYWERQQPKLPIRPLKGRELAVILLGSFLLALNFWDVRYIFALPYSYFMPQAFHIHQAELALARKDFFAAAEYGKKALQGPKDVQNTAAMIIGWANIGLGNEALTSEAWSMALQFGEEALKGPKDVQDAAATIIAAANIGLGNKAVNSKEWAAALQFGERALQQPIQDRRVSQSAHAAIAVAKFNLAQQPVNAGTGWTQMRLFEEARQAARKSNIEDQIAPAITQGESLWKSLLALNLGLQASAMGDVVSARRYIDVAEAAAKAVGDDNQNSLERIQRIKSRMLSAGLASPNREMNAISPAPESMGVSSLLKTAEVQTRASLLKLRAMLKDFHKRRRRFPKELSELVRQDNSMGLPSAFVGPYHELTKEVRNQSVKGMDSYQDTGGWGYYDAFRSKDFGGVFINCTHTDSSGKAWDSY